MIKQLTQELEDLSSTYNEKAHTLNRIEAYDLVEGTLRGILPKYDKVRADNYLFSATYYLVESGIVVVMEVDDKMRFSYAVATYD